MHVQFYYKYFIFKPNKPDHLLIHIKPLVVYNAITLPVQYSRVLFRNIWIMLHMLTSLRRPFSYYTYVLYFTCV